MADIPEDVVRKERFVLRSSHGDANQHYRAWRAQPKQFTFSKRLLYRIITSSYGSESSGDQVVLIRIRGMSVCSLMVAKHEKVTVS